MTIRTNTMGSSTITRGNGEEVKIKNQFCVHIKMDTMYTVTGLIITHKTHERQERTQLRIEFFFSTLSYSKESLEFLKKEEKNIHKPQRKPKPK